MDDRPWDGPRPPAAAYVHSEDRKGARSVGHFAGFNGVLQVDGYAGFKRLAGYRADGSVSLAFCWAHARRKFLEFHQSTGSRLVAEVLGRIKELYAIEAEIRRQSAERRQQVRAEGSRLIVNALHDWLQANFGRVSGTSDLAEAMRYAIRHWSGLILFLDDGCVEMDQRGGACHPVHCNQSQERVVRWLGWWRTALSHRDDADHHGEAEWRRADRLAVRRAAARHFGSNQDTSACRSAAAVELAIHGLPAKDSGSLRGRCRRMTSFEEQPGADCIWLIIAR